MFQSLKNKFKSVGKKENVIFSPIEGEVIPLANVNDPVFSGELMGKGIAFMPKKGRVVSPVDGKVFSVFETKYAVSLVSELGTEILIHIGINTVNLKGKYFKTYVQDGDSVHKGDLLLEFEMDQLKEAGYDTTSPMIICNTDQYSDIQIVNEKEVNELDEVMKVKHG